MAESKEYVKLWMSYDDYFCEYDDAAVGAIVRAMIAYRRDGTAPSFTGPEKFIWPAIRRDIDESIRAQTELSARRRESGQKGGTVAASKGKQNQANEANATFAKQNEANQANASNTKKKTKTNTKTTIISSSTATAESDISACVQAYEQNIGPIARAAFDDISRQLTDLPADLICEAIGEAALNNKRSWNYVKAILKRCREQNILSVDAYRAEKENHAAAAAARAAPAARPQSKQAAVRERLKKRLEEMGGAQSDDPADNRIYVEATELVAELLPGE